MRAFLSYAHKDRETAVTIGAALRALGLEVFVDSISLSRGGETFVDTITEAIEQAGIVLVLWSKNSIRSHWVRSEARFAVAAKKLVVPIIIDDTATADLPIEFQAYQTLVLGNQPDLAKSPQLISAIVDILASSKKAEEVQEQIDASESAEGAPQPHVFISHVEEDKPRVRRFVERLLEREIAVFVDNPAKLGLAQRWIGNPKLRYIRFFNNYRTSISKALDASACVLVFWSKHSVETERQIFWDEVEFGSTSGFLVSSMIDDVIAGDRKIPKGYGFSQANIANLCSEESIESEFEWVVSDIKQLIASHGKAIRLSQNPSVD